MGGPYQIESSELWGPGNGQEKTLKLRPVTLLRTG